MYDTCSVLVPLIGGTIMDVDTSVLVAYYICGIGVEKEININSHNDISTTTYLVTVFKPISLS